MSKLSAMYLLRPAIDIGELISFILHFPSQGWAQILPKVPGKNNFSLIVKSASSPFPLS